MKKHIVQTLINLYFTSEYLFSFKYSGFCATLCSTQN